MPGHKVPWHYIFVVRGHTCDCCEATKQVCPPGLIVIQKSKGSKKVLESRGETNAQSALALHFCEKAKMVFGEANAYLRLLRSNKTGVSPRVDSNTKIKSCKSVIFLRRGGSLCPP